MGKMNEAMLPTVKSSNQSPAKYYHMVIAGLFIVLLVQIGIIAYMSPSQSCLTVYPNNEVSEPEVSTFISSGNLIPEISFSTYRGA